MKTSNKLLLTLVGLLLGSLLTYNIALRAEYQKGNYKDKFRNFRTLALADFDQVEVGSSNVVVKLSQGKFAVRVSKNAAEDIRVTRAGRRLVITHLHPQNGTWAQANVVLISCPDLRALNSVATWAEVKGFALDSLSVQQGRAGEVELEGNRIGWLQARTGQAVGSQPQLKINASNRIQAADLALGSQSELTMDNVFIPQFTSQFSDSATATLTGASLGLLKR